MTDLATLAIRCLLTAATIWGAGSLLFLGILGGRSASADRVATKTAMVSSTVGVAASLVVAVLQLHAIGGDWVAAFDPYTLELFASSGGTALSLRILGFLLALVSLLGRRQAAAAWMAAILMVISFGASGHVVSHQPSEVLRIGVVLHVAAGAFWFGALLPLAASCRADSSVMSAKLVERFAAIAAVALVILVSAGLTLALFLSGRAPWEWWTFAWGQGLATKLALVGVLFAFAAHHRFSLGARLRNGSDGAGLKFARSIELETLVAVLVVVTTTIFASQFSPEGG